MEGGTTFHFVTDGIASALSRAKAAAGDRDVKIGGGVSTVRQYLLAGAIDELHLALSPVVLGRGESALGMGETDEIDGESWNRVDEITSASSVDIVIEDAKEARGKRGVVRRVEWVRDDRLEQFMREGTDTTYARRNPQAPHARRQSVPVASPLRFHVVVATQAHDQRDLHRTAHGDDDWRRPMQMRLEDDVEIVSTDDRSRSD